MNTFLGSSTGQNNTSGDTNVFLGLFAGYNVTTGRGNIQIGNTGPSPTESNTIRIGMWTPPMNDFPVNQNQVFIAPILANPTPNQVNVVTIDPTIPGMGGGGGQLGFRTLPTGGSQGPVGPTGPAGPAGPGVSANCPPTTNYVTKWLSTSSVGCSEIFDTGTPSIAGNVGIGTTNPGAKLDVNGNINATNTKNSYEIGQIPVLTIFGVHNLFVGEGAGVGLSITGSDNTFTGYNAGFSRTRGDFNAFFGSRAGQLYDESPSNCPPNTIECGHNTSVGALASRNHVTGGENTFLGFQAGPSFTSGKRNTFLGTQAGLNVQSGDNNIMIGNNVGLNAGGPVSNQIRIGGQGTQTDTYVAGIFGSASNIANSPVCIDSNGKLFSVITGCTTGSSFRFKEQIADMGESSSKLFQLRPVTFFYKPQYDDGSNLLQYGLIAEEVAKVYPEMVAYDKDGQPSSVKYQALAPMLLNEVQKQNLQIQKQAEAIQLQQEQNRKLETRLAALEALLSSNASAAHE
jgi:hypothetical protein